jgi:plastocyanin
LLYGFLGEGRFTQAQEADLVEVGMTETAPFEWTPETVNIEVGATVRWTVVGPAPHTVTSDGCGALGSGACVFDSGTTNLLRAGTPASTFEFTFDAAGVYPYYCRIHGTPGGVGQAGFVVVSEPGEEPPEDLPRVAPEAVQPNTNIEILSPREGDVIAGSSVEVRMSVDNATVRPSVPGVTDPRYGHYHLVLDTSIDLKEEVPREGSVPGVFHVAMDSFTLQNLAPGTHNLLVVWGFDNHYPSIVPITDTVRFTTTGGTATGGGVRLPATGDGGQLESRHDSSTVALLAITLGIVGIALAGQRLSRTNQ